MADGSSSSAGTARVPPSNLDAEGAVLAACLLDDTKAALDAARSVLGDGAAFYADANRRIWEAILHVDAEGKPVDVVLVAQRLRDINRLAQVGGAPYLAQLSDATPSIANVEAHARIVAALGRQRATIAVGQRIVAEGYGHVEDVQQWTQDGAQALADIVADGLTSEPPETFEQLVPQVIQEASRRARDGVATAGIETGWKDYTSLLGGWVRGKEHIIAARPGMGKTAFLLGSCINVAQQGLGVVFASAEMTKLELALRALGVAANVNTKKIETGRMTREEWAAVTAAAERLKGLPISIAYCPGARVSEIRGIFRTERQKLVSSGKCSELGLCAVDYIQILDGERQAGDSRETEVAGISKRLAWLAAEFYVALLAASQLSRECEKRPNKRPQLSDLRESGAIEQDAYSVTGLYRDEYYDKASSWAGSVEALLLKNRGGETGMARLGFIAESTRIANLTNEQRSRFGCHDENSMSEQFNDFADNHEEDWRNR